MKQDARLRTEREREPSSQTGVREPVRNARKKRNGRKPPVSGRPVTGNERSVFPVKTKVTALLLCILLIFSVSAWAESGIPEDWEPADCTRTIPQELLDAEWDADRAGDSAASAGEAVPATADRVVIRQDGSFEIDTGNILLASRQPFGWLYYTQSYEAQKDIYERNPGILNALVEIECHLFYSNSADGVQVFLFKEDDLNVTSRVSRDEVVADGLNRVSGYYRSRGYDSRVTELGGCPYLVVMYPKENQAVYQTIIGGAPVSAVVCYQSGITDLYERFMEETVLTELSISLKASDE